jgi:hypothetical protein
MHGPGNGAVTTATASPSMLTWNWPLLTTMTILWAWITPAWIS